MTKSLGGCRGFLFSEKGLLAFADPPVQPPLDLADGEAGFACELADGFLRVCEDVGLDFVFGFFLGDVEAFAAKGFLDGERCLVAVFRSDVVEQIVVFVTHGVVKDGPGTTRQGCFAHVGTKRVAVTFVIRLQRFGQFVKNYV